MRALSGLLSYSVAAHQCPGRGCNHSCTVVDVPAPSSHVQQTSRVMRGSTEVTCAASVAWFRKNLHYSK